jgi:hypothetical protein
MVIAHTIMPITQATMALSIRTALIISLTRHLMRRDCTRMLVLVLEPSLDSHAWP